jgi:hypothetical protein
VEIYNRSFKVVDLTELTLACLDTLTGLLTDVVNLSEESLLVFPGRYLVFTKDTAAIRLFYRAPILTGSSGWRRLPPLGNEDGSIALATRTGEIIDNLSLYERYAVPAITDAEAFHLNVSILKDLRTTGPTGIQLRKRPAMPRRATGILSLAVFRKGAMA